jgi:hypothetical protein
MRKTNHLLVITVLFAAAAFGAEEVYKTVGPDGSIIYSDTPSENAEKLIIEGVQTVESHDLPPSGYVPPPEDLNPYTGVMISSPQNDATLRPGEDDIAVSVDVLPQFDSKDTVVLYLDGSEHASGNTTSFALAMLDRGTHTLRAEVRGDNGAVLAVSDTVSFHVHRTTVQPDAGPGKPDKPPPPKPKPTPKPKPSN